MVLGPEGGRHPISLLQADDVDLASGQAPGHRPAGRPGADDQNITLVTLRHGVLPPRSDCEWRSLEPNTFPAIPPLLVRRERGAGGEVQTLITAPRWKPNFKPCTSATARSAS